MASSYARAMLRSVGSEYRDPMRCSPTGWPSKTPHGRLSPGSPVMLDALNSRRADDSEFPAARAVNSFVNSDSSGGAAGSVGETSALAPTAASAAWIELDILAS